MKKIIFLSVLIILIAGCASTGTKIDTSKVSQIKEGITTEQEVINIFGNPYMKSLGSDGKVIMLYQYTKIKSRASNFIPVVNIFSSGMDMKQQMLTVLIGKEGKVEKYTLNDSAAPINSGLLNVR